MESETPPYRLHDSLGYWLSVTARIQERRLDEKLREIGLTRITWCLLLGVANEGLSQPSELAEFVGIDRTATSRALRQLEQAGLLSRSSGTGDRRTRQIHLTDEGYEAVRIGTPFARANGDVMAARLGEAETVELRRLLRKLAEGEEAQLSHL
ncbi:MarR family winged helix-turn-helix transcriptional regulator [Pseudooceanicola marinus]|uniref:MarR family winged helix-turn-helix transcriptional regulator n=1 Tax=Pseudooceanicola marinus TaxID=396013 RepID=UPI001C943436|nr:MarR family transcriptional regulator [Pseudooceanicola marinus]MBY5973189.1 MarR family transcriptional regulator [Ferrimonas balearica]MCA1337034.1 MarR family transcriptional regulator [Pseudooceanicola marinus]